MATATSENRMDAPFGRETTVRSQKQKDILTQISDMYQKKQRVSTYFHFYNLFFVHFSLKRKLSAWYQRKLLFLV